MCNSGKPTHKQVRLLDFECVLSQTNAINDNKNEEHSVCAVCLLPCYRIEN